ncbi:DUF1330 domain-containing protein [Sphingomonas sp. AP4-R1]|uniref:DUF1330 domain-containing protein n=1 Tax=Sphingomonas sp. AP4-R1 TaxID=2735134 RepID=UPI001493B006|nr:DUF1330 domain-containing protein [Sphingomonas sp. AP4-R1]QJU59417.1 DUF1330 domain-containing protein [Sphingomonas sp. AP4-R1]
MTVYIVATREKTTDPAELAEYGKAAGAARGDHPLTPLAFYGKLDVLEGAPMEGAVILAFPDEAAARGWYESPEYQAARAHRLKGAEYRFFLIAGVDEPAAG